MMPHGAAPCAQRAVRRVATATHTTYLSIELRVTPLPVPQAHLGLQGGHRGYDVQTLIVGACGNLSTYESITVQGLRLIVLRCG